MDHPPRQAQTLHPNHRTCGQRWRAAKAIRPEALKLPYSSSKVERRVVNRRLSLLPHSIFQKSIPAACGGVSMLAVLLFATKSITSTVPGSSPTPSTVTNAYRLCGDTVTPCTTLLFVGIFATSFALPVSKIETDASRLFVAISSLPSPVTPRLYTPFAAGILRATAQLPRSTSTISFDLLQATNTCLPSTD